MATQQTPVPRTATRYSHGRHQTDRSAYGLTLAFAAVLGLMGLLIIISMASMRTIQLRLEAIVDNHNVKTELASNMYHAARERTIILHKMVLLDDPFLRDEEWMRFNRYGAEFAQARITLMSMHLSAQEQAILDEQARFTTDAVPLQNRVVELAFADLSAEAHRLLLDEALPAQNRVLHKLTELKNLQQVASRQAVTAADNTYRTTRRQMLFIGAAALILSLIIAVFFVRRTASIAAVLHREKERAQVTLHSVGEAVITTDGLGRIVYVNPVAELLTGWRTEQAEGRPSPEVFHIFDERDGESVNDPVTEALSVNQIVSGSRHTCLRHRNGRNYPIEHTAAPIRDRNGTMIGVVLVFRDVTTMRTMAERLSYQASHDTLTGLINRGEFDARLKEALRIAKAENTQHALCYLDLDQFKVVNDTCGHAAGDELLKQISVRLKQEIRDTDVLARLGGDEFAVLLEGCPLGKAREIAERLRRTIKDFRFAWGERSFEIGVSIGLVPIRGDDTGPDSVMSAADAACYAAKDAGRNRIHIYEPHDDELARRRGEMQWLPRINEALENDRFRLFYQRITPLSPDNGTRDHCEILLRLEDEAGQIVPPMAFIPAAERYNLMSSLDRWVVGALFGQLADMPHHAPAQAVDLFTINLSGQTLTNDYFLHELIELIEHSHIDPRKICFEITETAAIAHLGHATTFINTLKEKGCRFALDDFGNGLSSFSYLKNLAVDYLKIDGSFVRDIADDPIDLAFVQAINQVGHVLHLKTIAEFVENDRIVTQLRQLGVDYAQGYGIHRPAPLSELLTPVEKAIPSQM